MKVHVGNISTPWLPKWFIFSITPASSPISSSVYSTAQTTATQLLADIRKPERYDPLEVRPYPKRAKSPEEVKLPKYLCANRKPWVLRT